VSALVALRGVAAGYEGTAVVHDVDLEVGPGEVVALVGPNGAGKTTLLLTVSGLLTPLAGDLEVLGESVRPGGRIRTAEVVRRARRGLAHVPEDRGLFFELTAREHLRLAVSRRRRSSDRPTPPTLDEVLGWFPALPRVLDRRAGLLSGGEQQMLALARAVLGGPRLLLVDELSLGLAPLVVAGLLPTLAEIAHRTGAGVVIVEQHVAMALDVADRGYLLAGGRVLASGSAAELAANPDLLAAGYLGGGTTH
jgi:branched-chain amino acid transport system ATP-binding protein